MRDYNFFTSYIKVPEKKNIKGILLVIILVVIFALLLFYSWMLSALSLQKMQEIKQLDQFLESDQVKAQLKEVNDKQAELDQMQDLYDYAVSEHQQWTSNIAVSPGVVEEIAKALPSGMFIDTLSADGTSIDLNGFTKNYSDIAQYQYNLKEQLNTEDILVTAISQDDYRYSFSIQITSEEVLTHESN